MKLRKILSIFVTLCMLASMVTVGVSADISEYLDPDNTDISLTAPAVTVNVDDTIDIPVIVGDANGLRGAKIKVTWDPTLLTMSDGYDAIYEVYDAYTDKSLLFNSSFSINLNDVAEGYVTFGGARGNAIPSTMENFSLGTLHFKVNEAAAGQTIEIGFVPEETYINDGTQNILFSAMNGCEFTVTGGEEDSSEEDSSEEDSSEDISDYLDPNNTDISLTAPAVTVNVDDTIDIPVIVGDANGLRGAKIKVTWDPTLLTMSDGYDAIYEVYDAYTDKSLLFNSSFSINLNDVAEGYVTFGGARGNVIPSTMENFSLGTLHFKVNEAAAGQTIKISFVPEETYINDGTQNILFSAMNGCEFTVAGGEEDSSEEDSSEEDSSEEDSSEEDSSEEDSSEEDSSEEDSSEEDSSEEDSSEEDSSEEDSSEEDSSEEDSSEEDSSEEDSSEEDSSEEDSSEEDSSEEDSSEEDSSEEDSSEEDSSEEDSSEDESGVPSDVEFDVVRGKNAITVTVTAEANGSDITKIVMTIYDEDGEEIETVEVEPDEDGEFTYKFAGLKSGSEYTIEAVAVNGVGESEAAEIDVETKSSSSSKRGSSTTTVVTPTEPTEKPTEEPTEGPSEDATGEGSTGTNDGEVKFVDVLDRWSNEEVHKAAAEGLVNGRSNTIFDPTANLTRSESNKLLSNLVNALGGELERVSGAVIDTPAENWAYESDLWAVETGVMKGIDVLEDGTVVLGGSMNITRQDYMTTVARMIKAILGDVSVEGEATVYADEAEIAEYAAESVDFLSALGVVGGDGSNINPTDNISREEAAAIILRVHDLVSLVLAAE